MEIKIEHCKVFTKTVIKKDYLFDQQDKPDGSAMVCMDITLHNKSSKTVTGNLSTLIKASNFESNEKFSRDREVVLPPGKKTIKCVVTIKAAKLWWTWDHGYPHLYDLKITYLGDSLNLKVGIRDIRYDEKYGNWYLNDKKIFFRGIQCDINTWMKKEEEGVQRQELEKLIRKNVNAIRIKNNMNNTEFYDLCDELGLFICQEFYIDNCKKEHENFIAEACERIRKIGLQLTSHASIGMWSIYNHAIEEIDSPKGIKIVEETLKSVDPVRWVHSWNHNEKELNSYLGLYRGKDTAELNLLPNVLGLKTLVMESKEEVKEEKVVKEQIEYIRQHKYYPVSSIFLSYQNLEMAETEALYAPVQISLEACIHPYVLGEEKSFIKGTTFTGRVWIINDHYETIINPTISWKVVDLKTEETVASHSFKRNIAADSVEIPDHIVLPIKEKFAGHTFRVYMSVISEDAVILSENYSDFRVEL